MILFGFMIMLQKAGLKKLWQTVRVKVLQIKMAYLQQDFLCVQFMILMVIFFMTSGNWDPAKCGGDQSFLAGTGKFEGVTGGGTYLNGFQFMGGDTLNFVTSIEMPN